MKEIFLKPAEIVFCKENARISTVLGSCIAVCIFDTVNKYGGMCHYYLPFANGSENNQDKYGEYAIINLLRKFKRAGSRPENLEAKIAGGGNVIKITSLANGNVGEQNINIAKQTLANFNIKIVAESIGGSFGRKIRFYTHDGSIDLKTLDPSNTEVQNTIEEYKISGIDKTQLKKKQGLTSHEKTEIKLSQRNAPTSIKAGPIEVLIVDDSKSMRSILKKMLMNFPDIKVTGEASNADEAQKIIDKQKPDLITLDINMPGMDGVSFLKQYMPKTPIPTIMISSLNKDESGPVFEALESGAFDYIKKPSLDEIGNLSKELHDVIKTAFHSKYISKRSITTTQHNVGIDSTNDLMHDYILAIGASTGGTEAIKEILTELPANVPPIIITQHIPPVFSAAFADRLDKLCKFNVKEAENDDVLIPGHAFVAPGGMHMKIVKIGGKKIIKLTEDPPVNRFRPSVDYMFNSIAEFKSEKILAILLTGMGSDGANGLLNLKNQDAYTIAQDEATSAVYGMPKVAADIGAAIEIVPLHKISGRIAEFFNKK